MVRLETLGLRLLLRSVSVAACATLYVLLALGSHQLSIAPGYCDRLNESLLASQHYNRILKFAKCQTPFPRVVNINSELHPSAIKKYIPHCTILHYCGPHSGCCRHENEECVPKTIEQVKLYFWTIELTPKGIHKKGIEVINMNNHTECMCAPINASPQLAANSSRAASGVISEDQSLETTLTSLEPARNDSA